MKANELIIGDWVLIDGKPQQVEEIIWGQEVNAQWIFQKCMGGTSLDKVESIPLTEDILKANGFELNKNGDYVIDKPYDCYIKCSPMLVGIWFRVIITKYLAGGKQYLRTCLIAPYVHQFQNGLRLVGLDDLADNFKLKADDKS